LALKVYFEDKRGLITKVIVLRHDNTKQTD
jgi:hypothetical protein